MIISDTIILNIAFGIIGNDDIGSSMTNTAGFMGSMRSSVNDTTYSVANNHPYIANN